MENLGQYIKEQREARGVTLEQISKDTLVSISILKDIENGKFDKYQGDELYVKMYLRKVANYLGLDEGDLTSSYIELTQQLYKKDLVSEENDGNKTIFVKPLKTSKSFRRSSSVYEDNFFVRYLKYAAIVVVIAAIILVMWYAMKSTNSNNPVDYNPQPSGDVELGTTPNDQNTTGDKPAEDDSDNSTDSQSYEGFADITITNTNNGTYNMNGLKEGDSYIIEVTFDAQGAFNLWKGSTQVDKAYAIYEPNQTYTYEGVYSSTGQNTYTFNFWNLSNAVIKINGKVVEYDPTEVRVQDGVSYVVFYLKGE